MQRVNETFGWEDKALWMVDASIDVDQFVSEGHGLFDGSVSWPAMVLREPVLDANIATLAEFSRRHSLLFAPHGKTSMAPELFRRQLEAGAWGITVATPHQAMVALQSGVPRVFLAHQVLDAPALNRLAGVRAAHEGSELYWLVDSSEGVAAAATAYSEGDEPLQVLIDIGYTGGRTGVRSLEQAIELARQIDATAGVSLVGVSCYEGGLGSKEDVGAFFETVKQAADSLVDEGLMGSGAIVSAGGSAYFDVVADSFSPEWAESNGFQIMLRSGAYVSHDDGAYVAKTPFTRVPDEGHLDAALELWAQVVSAPEPGLVLVGMGRRDAPDDEGLPVVKWLRRAGTDQLEDLRGRATLTRMNDQHGYITVSDELAIRPGDLVCLGISHPCTAFDKWRLLPIVDADDQITDVVRTYF